MSQHVLPAGFVRLKDIVGPSGPLPISRSSLWLRISQGSFPKPIKLSPGVTVFRMDDVAAFVNDRENWVANNRALMAEVDQSAE
jgi:predicted DNA-binding transcriptional regulator AlpA